MTDDERELLERYLLPQPETPEMTPQQEADALELLFVDPEAKALAKEISEQSKVRELDDLSVLVKNFPAKLNNAKLNNGKINNVKLSGPFESDESVPIPSPLDPDDLMEVELNQTLFKPYATRQKIEFVLGAIAGVLILLILGSWIF